MRVGNKVLLGEKVWEIIAVSGAQIRIKYYCCVSGETIRRWIKSEGVSMW